MKSSSEFAAAINEAHKFDSKALVEQEITGSEIECAVLEIDGVATASTVGKIHIDSKFEFYDFQAKYIDAVSYTHLTLPTIYSV